MIRSIVAATFAAAAMAAAYSAAQTPEAALAALQRAPKSAHVAVLIPSAAALDAALMSTLTPEATAAAAARGMDPQALIASLGGAIGLPEAKRLQDVLAGAGLDQARPVAVFVQIGDDIEYAALLPVSDAAKAGEAITKAAPNGAFAETAFGDGGTKAQYNDTEDLGYAVDGDTLALASSKDLLGELAASKAAPASFAYGAGGNELAVVARLDALLAGGVLDAPAVAAWKPLATHFAKTLDEVHLAVGLGTPGYVRLSGHKLPAPPPAAAAPAAGESAAPAAAVPAAAKPLLPVVHHRVFPKESVAVLNFVFSPALFDLAGAVAGGIGGEATKARDFMTIGKAMIAPHLQGEASVAVLGLLPNKQPKSIVMLTAKNPDNLIGLLGIAKLPKEPRMTYKDKPILGAPDFNGMDFYLTTHKKIVVATNDEAAMKEMIDVLSGETPFKRPAFLPEALTQESNLGLLFVDTAKLEGVVGDAAPAVKNALHFSDTPVQLSLSDTEAFQSATLQLPGGLGSLLTVWVSGGPAS